MATTAPMIPPAMVAIGVEDADTLPGLELADEDGEGADGDDDPDIELELGDNDPGGALGLIVLLKINRLKSKKFPVVPPELVILVTCSVSSRPDMLKTGTDKPRSKAVRKDRLTGRVGNPLDPVTAVSAFIDPIYGDAEISMIRE